MDAGIIAAIMDDSALHNTADKGPQGSDVTSGSSAQSASDSTVYQSLVQALKKEYSFDFVSLAPVPRTEPPELMWKYAAGNTNNRFERIVLPPGIGVMGIVYGSRRPLVVENVNQDIPRKDQYQYPIVAAEGLVSFFALPLMRTTELAAILLCAYRSNHAITQEMLKSASDFIGQASPQFTALYQTPVRPSHESDELSFDGTTHKVLQAQEEERKRIARELHDGIAHEILLAQIELRKLKYLSEHEKDEGIERASEYLRQIMKHVNVIAVGLRPSQLDELGLGSAVKAYALMLQDSYGVAVTTDIDHTLGLTKDQETTLYRIFQEAATNACKYSRSETIAITLQQDAAEAVVLSVQDYGVGFDVQQPTIHGGGLGLVGMQERSELIGATVNIVSQSGQGTCVTVVLPREERP